MMVRIIKKLKRYSQRKQKQKQRKKTMMITTTVMMTIRKTLVIIEEKKILLASKGKRVVLKENFPNIILKQILSTIQNVIKDNLRKNDILPMQGIILLKSK
jgi:DNA topoisomerase VI subunit B